ncbi:MAG TPA: hypothetical protein DCL41_06155 [Bdellovibrionales bacterium]|nr:hypothetical protein [Pseudobdellovibrionaceae bacterium]HAG91432.1 hypothetical protein [Bdellovibrionales bacterium]
MEKPVDSKNLSEEVERLRKINLALMKKVESGLAQNQSAFGIFESNVLLENKVKERTRALESLTSVLNQERNRLAILIRSLPGSIVIYDLNLKPIEVYLGRCGTKTWGDNEGFIQNAWPHLHAGLKKAINPNQGKVDLQFGLWMHLDSQKLHFECSVSELSDHTFLLYIQDDTKDKEQEEIIASQKSQIAQAAKLAALGEMAGGIAHEINTPLTTISLLTGKLVRGLTSEEINPEDLIQSAGRIQDTVLKISTIVKSLKQISRDTNSDALRTCLLCDVLAETTQLCSSKFRSMGIDLRINAPTGIKISVRPVQIEQVLLNLLNNSAYAVKDLESPWIAIDCLPFDDSVEIRVTDSGPGIPEDILEKIFNPFFTTKPIGEGTGIGMSISRSFIKDHGSDLTYELRNGNTSFRFEVRKVSEEAEQEKAS